ncbi:hypothetical protein ACSNOI_00345 [Actinomadura kijaniata]|uniref:hypothetical protein n=1 Tax=Actinomadura kijaniata TaxID=46161 RepID=UPI003F1E1E66
MTGQINDRVVYEGETYSLVGENGEGLFDPAAHGLEVRPLSTACWRGFIAEYTVAGDRLLLTEVELGLADPDAEVFGVRPRGRGHGNPPHTGLEIPVDFTGGLLIGRDFVQDLYVHMGFQAAWKYERVHELTFENGRLVGAVDRSEEAARERAAPPPQGPASDAPGATLEWIKQTFSRRYR